MVNEKQYRNYTELKTYQEGSTTSNITLRNLRIVFDSFFGKTDASKQFCVLDVGSGNGNLSLPFIYHIKQKLRNLKYVAVEPETPAFQKLNERIKENKISYAETHNLKFEDYIRKVEKRRELFNFILFSQCWYHFPKKEWKFILKNAFRILKKNGIMIIVIDSHLGEAYKLKSLITKGKADTLEFGDLYSAEDVEKFISGESVKYTVKKFPVYLYIQESRRKIFVLARILAFLYRTSREKILKKHRKKIEKFIETLKKQDGYYVLENLVKMIVVRK